MRESVDKIIITNLPSFYKINLYNEINKSCKLLVIYTWDHLYGRNQDFFDGTSQFNYVHLKKGRFSRIFQIMKIILSTNYKELILSGWDSVPLWIGALISSKPKNSIVVESSLYESSTTGIKGIAKRLFLSRVSKVYASGKSQKALVEKLGFNNNIVITKGVGIFNYISQPPYSERTQVSKFLFVGRLTAVKNLHLLIRVFNDLPNCELTIVGFGELEFELKSMTSQNIKFLGAVPNKHLNKVYQEHDVFILPSYSEAWGLVVEEALNNGLPVIVSDRVGCAEEIIEDGKNGLIFKNNDADSLRYCIRQIQNIKLYNNMRKNISELDFEEIERSQTQCYI